jgi:hypothetical protein
MIGKHASVLVSTTPGEVRRLRVAVWAEKAKVASHVVQEVSVDVVDRQDKCFLAPLARIPTLVALVAPSDLQECALEEMRLCPVGAAWFPDQDLGCGMAKPMRAVLVSHKMRRIDFECSDHPTDVRMGSTSLRNVEEPEHAHNGRRVLDGLFEQFFRVLPPRRPHAMRLGNASDNAGRRIHSRRLICQDHWECVACLQASSPSSRRSLATWPVALTLYCATSTLPCSSTTNVERITPCTVLPYICFSP